jgi:hypothetical protein
MVYLHEGVSKDAASHLLASRVADESKAQWKFARRRAAKSQERFGMFAVK